MMATKKIAAPKKAAPAKKMAKKASTTVAKAVTKKVTPAKKVVKPAVKKIATAKKTINKATKPVAKAPAKKAVALKKTAKPAAEKAMPKPIAKPKDIKDQKSKPVATVAQAIKPAIKKEVSKPQKIVMPTLSTKSAIKYQPDFTKSVLDTNPKLEAAQNVVRYSDNDLQEFKEIILRKLDAAKKELAYLQGLITRRDEGGDMDEGRYMTMEDGSVSMEREQLSQLASRQITFIDHLEKALVRVENKSYGICRVTGNLIDKARLRAVPHATLSIEAKMMNK